MVSRRKKAIVSVYIPHSLKEEIDGMAAEVAEYNVKRSTFLAQSLEMGALMMATVYAEMPQLQRLQYASIRLALKAAKENGLFNILGEEEE